MATEKVRTLAPDAASTGSWCFEDFVVGQGFEAGPRRVTEADLETFAAISGDHHPLHADPDFAARTRFDRPVLHGPFGLAVVFGLFHELGLVVGTEVALLDTMWTYRAPIYVGDALSMTMTITRCRRGRDATAGVVNRHVELRNQAGEIVQQGTTAFLVPARTAGPDPVGLAFACPEWGVALAAALNEDGRFGAAVASWDGTIGLRSGSDEIQLRVYRGRVLEAVRRTPAGPTFTLAASELTWTELVTGPRNDFMRRVMLEEFTTTGNAYEYLRMTKALDLIVDAARRIGQEC